MPESTLLVFYYLDKGGAEQCVRCWFAPSQNATTVSYPLRHKIKTADAMQ